MPGILEDWEKRAKEEIGFPDSVRPLFLKDSLPSYLEDLAATLQPQDSSRIPWEQTLEKKFDLHQVIVEYQSLREVLITHLTRKLQLSPEAAVILHSHIDRQIRRAAAAFTGVKESTRFETKKKRLDEFFMQIPTPICILVGKEHRYLFANPPYEKLMDRMVIGKTLSELYSAEELGPFLPLINRVYESGIPYVGREVPRHWIDDQGKSFQQWLDISYYPYRGDDGIIRGIVALVYDVTGQVNSRRKLLESEERFRQVSDNLTDQVVHVLELNPPRISYVSPSYEKIWKGSLQDLYADPTHFTQRVHPEDLPKLHEVMKLQGEGLPTRVEYRLVFEDGSIRWIKDHAFPVKDAEGKVYRCTGIAEDITESRLSKERLQESEAKFRTITEAMPQMVWSTRADGYHDFYNQGWYDFTGVAPGSTDGEGWNSMFHPDDQERAWKVWRHSLETGEPYEIEYRLRHRSGGHRWTLGRALPVRNEAGEITRWMGTCTDIQSIRETGEELSRVVLDLKLERELRDRFVEALTHDLRTPLTVARMTGQMLSKVSNDAEMVKSLGERIVTDMDRADTMIRDLLDANRIKAGGGIPVAIQECQLNQILEVTLSDLSRFHGKRFEMQNQAVHVQGYWDGPGLRRVIENIAVNAIKYGQAGAPILIRLCRIDENEEIELSVHNFGNPISLQDQKQIFTPYGRSEAALKGGQKGWGIGLTLVKGIVDAHHGTVRVESSPQMGTTFFVRLPLDCRNSSA